MKDDPTRGTLVAVMCAGVAMWLSFLLGYNVHPANRCAEDEVYAVQVDTNPDHGLTRQCESADTFIYREFIRTGAIHAPGGTP